MALDLSSVNAKVSRSIAHADALRQEVRTWFESNPDLITCENNSDNTVYRVLAHIKTPPPRERWGLMIGDSVHNLRSSLDHLVYAIAVLESGKTPPPDENRLAFPITDTATDFHSAAKRT